VYEKMRKNQIFFIRAIFLMNEQDILVLFISDI